MVGGDEELQSAFARFRGIPEAWARSLGLAIQGNYQVTWPIRLETYPNLLEAVDLVPDTPVCFATGFLTETDEPRAIYRVERPGVNGRWEVSGVATGEVVSAWYGCLNRLAEYLEAEEWDWRFWFGADGVTGTRFAIAHDGARLLFVPAGPHECLVEPEVIDLEELRTRVASVGATNR
jgi:hypothetical protein